MDRHRVLIAVFCLLALPTLADQGGPVYAAIPAYPAVGGACTTGRVQARQDTGDLLCCVAAQWAACGSAVRASGAAAVGIVSSVASGSNGFACTANGCRIDLGAGANDYLYSDGAAIITPTTLYAPTFGAVAGTSALVRGAIADGATAVAVRVGSVNTLTTEGAQVVAFCADSPSACATKVAYIDKHGSIAIRTSPTLATCAAGLEGQITRQTGGTSGTRTRLCCCTSDGAGTPAYAWKNITTVFASEAASIGTTTTCP